ncbi:hypothetical protein GRI69_12285 [Erythrobacter vulgaris]|uniref:Thermonuclease family protein n=1 Tax=Qipengyuania vulgaris TaxID=291985 RepID=A0A844XUZ5_9SPHN|nr:hypothetical protein [Qipengyuania vulgaris]MXO49037.1 hypothetical protein [Qipengyuania vulgaris]
MSKRTRISPARFRPRRRRGGWRWMVVLALVLGAWWVLRDVLQPPAPVSAVDMRFGICGERGGEACVIDGDTLAIGQRRVRLTGYDAPEMDGACEAERAKAMEARDALSGWLARGRFSWTGGAEPPRDQYGRELREARRGDDVLADHMIGAGLAEGSVWGGSRVDWCR